MDPVRSQRAAIPRQAAPAAEQTLDGVCVLELGRAVPFTSVHPLETSEIIRAIELALR